MQSRRLRQLPRGVRTLSLVFILIFCTCGPYNDRDADSFCRSQAWANDVIARAVGLIAACGAHRRRARQHVAGGRRLLSLGRSRLRAASGRFKMAFNCAKPSPARRLPYSSGPRRCRDSRSAAHDCATRRHRHFVSRWRIRPAGRNRCHCGDRGWARNVSVSTPPDYSLGRQQTASPFPDSSICIPAPNSCALRTSVRNRARPGETGPGPPRTALSTLPFCNKGSASAEQSRRRPSAFLRA